MTKDPNRPPAGDYRHAALTNLHDGDAAPLSAIDYRQEKATRAVALALLAVEAQLAELVANTDGNR